MAVLTSVPIVQNEVSSLISRWRLNDAAGSSLVVDDAGGINLLTVGAPAFSLPSMTKDDAVATSVLGSVGNYFSAIGVAPYPFSGGLTIEGTSKMDPGGNAFNLISIPGQASLTLSGVDVIFTVWFSVTPETLTASGALLGWPQHIVGTYDVITGLMSLYVDGVLVGTRSFGGVLGAQIAQQTTGTISTSVNPNTIISVPSTAGMQVGGVVLSAGNFASGTVITSIPSSTSIVASTPALSSGSKVITFGMPVTIASPTTLTATQAAAQDVAVYTAPLSPARVLQHFQALRQILPDPGHSRVYPQIGVYA